MGLLYTKGLHMQQGEGEKVAFFVKKTGIIPT